MTNTPSPIFDTAEGQRIVDGRIHRAWRRWGPYLSERQWGTVREDYSPHGTAWDYLPHDHARSRAYRWGEDGIAGFSDEELHWCLSLAVWNERDPILKERLFGLTNSEGSHGEDVKELYFYVDATPTHSYMRMVYKYPHAAFPYERLLHESQGRPLGLTEFEVVDTGVFDDDRYFDIVVEYAKASPDDILMKVTATNRSDEAAPLHLLPHFWARNDWSWDHDAPRPVLLHDEPSSVLATHPKIRERRLFVEPGTTLLFCENETNNRRLYGATAPGPVKDGIADFVVHGDASGLSAGNTGTKCAAHVAMSLAGRGSATVRLRLRLAADQGPVFEDFDAVMAQRQREADEFYAAVQREIADPDARLVQRQALAGMIWSKQYFNLDIPRWLDGDPAQPPPPPERETGRNAGWRHLNNADIISMPDKWEYPWYAAWDLAFHCVTFAMIDPEFAKAQLVLLLREWYMHPNGQLPAYEWAFGDVNPPVHAWAAWRVYEIDRTLTGVADRAFLERVFHKLMLNFTWWVNRKDINGRNIFQGGFLGLDNIGIFDRSSPLPFGGTINQSDGTAWMAMYALNLMRIAIELAHEDHVYEDIATKFFEHFLQIAEAMSGMGHNGLWDEQDQFFYDVLSLDGGQDVPMRVRSLVGVVPLFAVEVLTTMDFEALPYFAKRLNWYLDHRPDLAALVSRWQQKMPGEKRLLSMLRGHRTLMILRRLLDETEFLSGHGIRSVSKFHDGQPFVFHHDGHEWGVDYEPGESLSNLFGGNSNWRGPVWMPMNFMIIESLYAFHGYYGDDFRVEYPLGSGATISLSQVADEIARRVKSLFLKDAQGLRPCLAGSAVPKGEAGGDLLLFHEYFHGDTGRGLGASHQTGWTGIVALLLGQRPGMPPCELGPR